MKCIVILVISTVLFALVSDTLTNSVEAALSSLGLTQGFVGVFLIGTFGNAAEIINAIGFGLNNNIALSIEIGAAGTIQNALIQVPGLVFFSAIINHLQTAHSFIMVFPSLNVFAIIFSVIIVNYISMDGKSNYFEGTALIIVYIILVTAFYFVPV